MLQSADGNVYLPANSAGVTTSSQSSKSVLSVRGTAVAAGQAGQTSVTNNIQNVSAVAAQPVQTSVTNLGQNVLATAKGSSSPTITPTSIAVFNLAGPTSSRWPSSITFVSQSSNVPVVGIAFVTTINGTSLITNSQPKQSLITSTGSIISQFAVTEGNTTTTLKLATLPTASPLPQASGVQVVSESGSPVIYNPLTLSGYSNSGPAEISTNFVEVINGQTTTQGGWWLIGAGGVIDPPNNKPWKNGGDTVGCLGGPLLCNRPWVEIGGGFGVQFPGSGTAGPPGYPGGPVDGAVADPEDNPPPYDNIDPVAGDSGTGQDPKDDPDENKTAEQTTQARDTNTASERKTTATASSSKRSTISLSRTLTSRMTTSSANSTTRATSSSPVSTSASRAQYFINAAVNASQDKIIALLKEFDPDAAGKSYMPDVSATPADGGLWVGYNLTSNQAQNISSRSDVLMVNTYTDTPLSFPTESPVAVLSDTDPVTLWTLASNTTSTQAGLSPSAVCCFHSKTTGRPQACLIGPASILNKPLDADCELCVDLQFESPK